MKTPIAMLPLCAALVLNGCATMDDKTQSAGIGAAIGCAAGAALAALTDNDTGGGCAAGALVGGIVGYIKARNAEVDEARRAAESATTTVQGATVAPVQTEQVQVVDTKAKKTETVSAFKSVSVDIPLSQVDTPEGREAIRKLEAYARKTANERGETIDMTLATAPGKDAPSNSKVTLMETVEAAGQGKVRRSRVADPRVPGAVQRITIEAKNQARVEV